MHCRTVNPDKALQIVHEKIMVELNTKSALIPKTQNPNPQTRWTLKALNSKPLNPKPLKP